MCTHSFERQASESNLVFLLVTCLFPSQQGLLILCSLLQAVETSSKVRPPVQMPTSLGPLPQNVVDKLGNAGPLPTLAELGLSLKEQSPLGVMRFVGGEKAALARIQDYFWTKVSVVIFFGHLQRCNLRQPRTCMIELQ